MDGTQLIESARSYAIEKHAGLFRMNRARQPYHVHVIEVGQLVAQSGGSTEEIAAGLLHDTREDTNATDAEIRALFGDRVADLVDGLTDPEEFAGMPTLERKTLQAERVRGKSDGVKRAKLADGTSNLRSVATDPPVSWTRSKCEAYIEGARRVAEACAGVSLFLESEFRAAHAAALASLDTHYPPVLEDPCS